MASASSSSSSDTPPCGACKAQRKKCTPDCVFAAHIPPDDIQKFRTLHKAFGASNVSKLLSALPPESRGEAVTSLFFEADARLRSPVYGCVGMISLLQERLSQLESELADSQAELNDFERHRQRLRMPGRQPEEEMARVGLEQERFRAQQQALMGFRIHGGGDVAGRLSSNQNYAGDVAGSSSTPGLALGGVGDDNSNWLTVAGGFSNQNYAGDVAGSSSTAGGNNNNNAMFGDTAYYDMSHQQQQQPPQQFQYHHGYDHHHQYFQAPQPSQEQQQLGYNLGKPWGFGDDQGTSGLGGNYDDPPS